MRSLLHLLLIGALVGCIFQIAVTKGGDPDEDFSEFDDDFDEDFPQSPKQAQQQQVVEEEEELINEDVGGSDQAVKDKNRVVDDDEVLIEDDDFETPDDDEFDLDEQPARKREMPPKLTITSVPMPIRGWQAYWAELLVISGIVVYLVNYAMGRYKNQKIAQAFFDINWNILEENFAMLGDSNKPEDEQGTQTFQKTSDSQFQMWCSGRVCCEGMLVELKLLKRHDLVSIISNIFRPQKDLVRFQVEMGKEDLDQIVFAVANKKTATKMAKEYNDIINFCPDRRSGEKYGLNNQLVVMSEVGEVATGLIDARTTSVINKYANLIDAIHFTDQFSGLRTQEQELSKEGMLKLPEVRRFLFFTFALPTSSSGNNAEEAIEEFKPLFQFVFHTIDRLKRFRLSREGKTKTDKNRAKVEEAFMKQTHVARAEAAAVRREEKRRQEKERILSEDDPDKQRRWEEREQKREKKRKTPKMKQLKVKAM